MTGTVTILKARVRTLANVARALRPASRIALALTALLTFWGAVELTALFLARVDELPLFAAILKWRLLNMTVFAFFYMLVLSTVVTALGAFFAAEDLPLLLVSPASAGGVFAAKYIEAALVSGGISTTLFLAALLGFARSYGVTYNFLPAVLLILPPFLLIPSALAGCAALAVGRFFSARTAHYAFQGLLIGLAVLLVFFFRSLEPERLFRGDQVATIAAYLRDLSTPASDAEPSGWIAATLLAFFNLTYEGVAWNLVRLYGATLTLLAFLAGLARLLYLDGVRRAAESIEAVTGRSVNRISLVERLARFAPLVSRPVLWKDTLLFFRTPVMTSQAFMLLAVAGIYVYNIVLLPIDPNRGIWRGLCDLFGFLNAGMVAFIAASAALRFVYPALAAEGRAFSVVRVAPLTPARWLLTKQVQFSLLFLAFTLPLTAVTNRLLHAGPGVTALAWLDALLLTPAVVAVNLGLGIHFPNTGLSTVTDAPASVGGLTAMIACSAAIFLTLGLQAPAAFPHMFHHFEFGERWYDLIAPGGLALSLAAAGLAAAWPLRLALARLESGEGLP